MKSLEKIFQNIFRTSVACFALTLLPFGIHEGKDIDKISPNSLALSRNVCFATNSSEDSAEDDVVVYITRTGKCFHAGCSSCLKHSEMEISAKKAKENGYKKCLKCFE